MNRKNNVRFQETDRRIKEYVLAALSRQENDQLTVLGICNALHLNRSTFYIHFRDIDEVIKAVTAEINNGLSEIVMQAQDAGLTEEEAIRRALNYIHDNRTFYLYYFRCCPFETIFANLRMVCEIAFVRGANLHSHEAYVMDFLTAGFLSVISSWLLNGCRERIEDMTDLIRSLIPAEIILKRKKMHRPLQ